MKWNGGILKRILLFFLPLLFSFSTCGHRGNPLPPLTKVPSTPQVDEIVQDFNRPLLSWNRVYTYKDGRKLPNPKEVRYIVSVNFGKRRVETEENYLLDSPIKLGEKRCYSVIAVYRGKRSSPTEPVCLVGRAPIEDVPVFRARGGDGKVVIEVENPELPVEVFRNGRFPFLKPYKAFKGRIFVDRSVKNGAPYTYRLRFFKGKLKGKLSEGVTIIPQDRIPPSPPPSGYFIRRNGCTVFWEPSPSKDVVFYGVKVGSSTYRASGIYLNLPGCSGKVEIFAVDKAGNRSKPVEAEEVK